MGLSLRDSQRSFPVSYRTLPDGWVEYTIRIQGDIGPSLLRALNTLLDLSGCLDAASRASARDQKIEAWREEQRKLKHDIRWEFFGLLEEGVKYNEAVKRLAAHPKFAHLGWPPALFRGLLPRAKELPFYSSKRSRRVRHDLRGQNSIYRKLLFGS